MPMIRPYKPANKQLWQQVVHADGAPYHWAGACMLVTEDGQLTGVIKLFFGCCVGGPLQNYTAGGFAIQCDKINGCKTFRIGF